MVRGPIRFFTRIDFSESSGVVVEDEVLEHPVSRVGLEELELDVDLILFLAFRNLVLLFLLLNFCMKNRKVREAKQRNIFRS